MLFFKNNWIYNTCTLKYIFYEFIEYKELLDKYHSLLQSNGNQLEDCKASVRIEAERDLLKVSWIFLHVT